MARRFINHEYFIRITLVIYVARLKRYFLIQKREETYDYSNNSDTCSNWGDTKQKKKEER